MRLGLLTAWLCVAWLALESLAYATAPPQNPDAALKSEANTYSRAAGLPALDAHSGFELRVWGYGYMTRSVTGIIVSNGQLRLFITSSTYENGTRNIDHARLSAPVPVTDTQKLKSLVAKLEPLNGTTVECPMFDGGESLIEAVVDGRTIRIKAINTIPCAKPNAKAINQLLFELGDDAATLCLTREEVTHPTSWVTGLWLSKARQNDEGEDEVLVFRHDGTLVFYYNDHDPYYPGPELHYTVSGNAIHIKDKRLHAEHMHVTLHANRDRSRLVLQVPNTKKRVIYVRMAGKRCINPRELEKGDGGD